MRKKLFPASAVLFATLSLLVSAKAQLITFDDLPAVSGSLIPAGYSGFNWTNFYIQPGALLPGTGFDFGTRSPPNSAFNGAGNPASFFSDTTFNLESFSITGAWSDGLKVDIEALSKGVTVHSGSFQISVGIILAVTFNNWNDLDTVTIRTSGGVDHDGDSNGSGTHFVMDNLAVSRNVTAVPEPAVYGLAGVASLALLSAVRQLRRRKVRVA